MIANDIFEISHSINVYGTFYYYHDYACQLVRNHHGNTHKADYCCYG